jgi:hypothetical protein
VVEPAAAAVAVVGLAAGGRPPNIRVAGTVERGREPAVSKRRELVVDQKTYVVIAIGRLSGAGQRHSLQIVSGGLDPASYFEFPQRDGTILVFRGHLFPFLDAGNTGASHRFQWICHRLTGRHVSQLDERYGNQAWASQSADWFRDKPFRVRLRDHDDGFACLGL